MTCDSHSPYLDTIYRRSLKPERALHQYLWYVERSRRDRARMGNISIRTVWQPCTDASVIALIAGGCATSGRGSWLLLPTALSIYPGPVLKDYCFNIPTPLHRWIDFRLSITHTKDWPRATYSHRLLTTSHTPIQHHLDF
jgi:hypothetical protein